MFRSLILFIALLAQALPMPAMPLSEESAACSMSCCTTVAQMEDKDCGCFEAPVRDTLPSPAQTPPPPTRDLLPQPQWHMQAEPLVLPYAGSRLSASHIRPQLAPGSLTQPHVRLPVLFCSLLT